MHAHAANLRERVFRPGSGQRPRNNALLFLGFALIVVLSAAPDWGSRLAFMVFVAVFFGLNMWFLRRRERQCVHVLGPGSGGVRYGPLSKTCEVDTIPWTAIRSLDIVYGTHGPGVPGPGPRWLRIWLEDGEFRRRVSTRALERIAGGDLNILLEFDASPEVILSTARAFQSRHGSNRVAGDR